MCCHGNHHPVWGTSVAGNPLDPVWLPLFERMLFCLCSETTCELLRVALERCRLLQRKHAQPSLTTPGNN